MPGTRPPSEPTPWEALYKIENAVWVDYLRWLQRVLSLPVEHQVEVTSIVPPAGS